MNEFGKLTSILHVYSKYIENLYQLRTVYHSWLIYFYNMQF